MREDAVAMHLEYAELFTVAQQGIIRTMESIYRGRHRRPNLPDEDAFGTDIRAAGTEYVVAKYLGLPWHLTIRRFGQADVGENVHVRSTRHMTGRLVLRQDDKKVYDPYVLVVGAYPKLWLVGWAFGYEVCQDKYRSDPNGMGEAWWMPQIDLRSMTTLHEHARPQPASLYQTPKSVPT